MPSSQKLALNCNFRWRYKESKFDSIPYKPFKICSSSFILEPTQNQRDLYGAISNFDPLYFGWELQLRGSFWQGPFFKDALLENGTKSHNFTNLFFCDVTLRYSSRSGGKLVVILLPHPTGLCLEKLQCDHCNGGLLVIFYQSRCRWFIKVRK